MNINPIEIEIKDNYKYTQVAYLVDRDDFLSDILKIRNKYLKSGIINHEKFKKELNQNRKNYTYKHFKNRLTNKIIKDIEEDKMLIFKKIKLEEVADKLTKKYHQNDVLSPIILFSIACGKVTEEDFNNFDTFKDNLMITGYPKSSVYGITYMKTGSSIKLNEEEAAIIINPYSTEKDLKGLFQHIKKKILKKEDIISNIRRDREWYWLKRYGKSYGKIHKFAEEKGFNITRDAVIKAIKQYSSRLEQEL